MDSVGEPFAEPFLSYTHLRKFRNRTSDLLEIWSAIPPDLRSSHFLRLMVQPIQKFNQARPWSNLMWNPNSMRAASARSLLHPTLPLTNVPFLWSSAICIASSGNHCGRASSDVLLRGLCLLQTETSSLGTFCLSAMLFQLRNISRVQFTPSYSDPEFVCVRDN